jgi:hypothetical protein
LITLGYLYHGDSNSGWEKLFVILSFVGVPLASTVIFDNKVHLLDAFCPDDGLVLPEIMHTYILLKNTFVGE